MLDWGETGPLPCWMVEHVLMLARSNTVRITNLDGVAFGTGFVIDGKEIAPASAWEDETVLVTCAHVVSSYGSRTVGSTAPLHPRAAQAVRIDGTVYGLREVIWEGKPGSLLDVSIARFSKPFPAQPPRLVPYNGSVEEFECPRVFLVGYPAGRNLSLSHHPENERIRIGRETGGDAVRNPVLYRKCARFFGQSSSCCPAPSNLGCWGPCCRASSRNGRFQGAAVARR